VNAVQPTREEALAVLDEHRGRLLELLARVPEAERATPGIGGGEWSVKDLVGHLAFWEELAVDAVEAWRREERPLVADYFDAGQEGIDAANAENHRRKASWDYEEVRTDADAVHDRLVAMIGEMSDEEWRRKAPYPTERRKTMVSLLGSIVGAPAGSFAHASAHLPDLEAFVSSLGG
jgi:hypothetical protein